MNENERGKLFRNGLKAAAGVMLASTVLAGTANNNIYGANISQTQEEDIIKVPEGFGKIITFEAWDYPCGNDENHWDYSSKQYEFWEKAGGLTSYDENGVGFVNGSYVVAVTDTYGVVGDFILVKFKDGTIIPFVIGDEKNQDDKYCNEYGHLNGENILELMVKTDMWYNKGYEDIAALKPEWYDKEVDCVLKTNVNYLKNPEYTIPNEDYGRISNLDDMYMEIE